MTIIHDMRESEVLTLRHQNKELSRILAEFMLPQGAADVIEAWICAKLHPTKEELKLLDALRLVCNKEGWA